MSHSTDNQARDIYISCASYREAKVVVEEIITLFQAAAISYVPLLYGVTDKIHAGFVVIEYYQPLPGDVLTVLMSMPDVVDFVIYDAPGIDQERQAEQQSMIEATPMQEASDRQPLTPPMPPAEFTLLSAPMSLLTAYDERWIARATGPEGLGYLIYEDYHCVLFLPIDEAIVALAVMSLESRSWIDYVSAVSESHRQLIAEVRSYWHMVAREEALLKSFEKGGSQQ